MNRSPAGPVGETDSDLLTWPRWLGRGAAFGLVVGLGATMFAVGRSRGGDGYSAAEVVAIGAVFAAGGFLVGLWEQVRPTSWVFVRDAVWRSWRVWLIEIVAVGGLGCLAGVISQ